MADPLARAGGVLTDPTSFGGGADRAEVTSRVQTVAYGYLAVMEGYRHPEHATVWSALTVTLPCPVPAVAVDHRSALGRPGVAPSGGWSAPVGERRFDDEYVVTAADSTTIGTLFTGRLCELLDEHTVQRVSFDRRCLLLRTFDGSEPTASVLERLSGLAGEVLAATPAFVVRVLGASEPSGPPMPFPPGLYG
jgi:hypothetical protein